MSNVSAKMMDLSAAADYLGTGAIEVPMFEREIVDVLRRSSTFLRRVKQKPATGHPHRYFEQTAIATAAAVDPRSLSASATGPTRLERPAFIKAVTAQSNISLFDKDVTEQQGQFASVVAKDVNDIVSAIEVKRAKMVWAGTDTSMSSPTTLEWMGGLAQITQQFVCTNGASIIDALKSAVATMLANQTYDISGKISAIYVNPLLADFIDQEAKAARITLNPVEAAIGVTVQGLSTQAGILPIISDAYIPTTAAATAEYGFSATPAGIKGYYAAIVCEEEIEIPVISGSEYNPNPRLFQLGLVGNLSGQYVGVKFDTIIFKAGSYAHSVVQIQRP